MRWALLIMGLAWASQAQAQAQAQVQAQTPRCRHELFHPATCAAASQAKPASALPAAQAPAPQIKTPPPRPVERQVATASPAPRPAPPQPAGAEPQPTAGLDPRTVAPYACNMAEQLTLGPTVCKARGAADTRRKIGALIHEGRCAEAVRAAQALGDEAFTARVHDFCRPG